MMFFCAICGELSEDGDKEEVCRECEKKKDNIIVCHKTPTRRTKLEAVREAAERTIKEFERKPEQNAFLVNELMGLRNALKSMEEPNGKD